MARAAEEDNFQFNFTLIDSCLSMWLVATILESIGLARGYSLPWIGHFLRDNCEVVLNKQTKKPKTYELLAVRKNNVCL